MEDRALGGGTYGMCVLGLPRRWPPPCWAEERKTAPRGPTAAQCHVEAEVELEGTQDSEGGRLGTDCNNSVHLSRKRFGAQIKGSLAKTDDRESDLRILGKDMRKV